jgi:fido (protein-threonine AMPylation protein)
MPRYSGSDPYLDPATGVLKNRLDITDEATLEATEADIVMARSYELEQSPIRGRFDLDHLRTIHHYLFSSLYDWAGELRTVDIGKSGSRFAHHGHLDSAAAAIFKQLAAEQNLAGLELEQFAARAAHLLGELNALHPFREGNGRTQRQFISQLAQANGYVIAWQNIALTPLLDATIASFHGDTSKLAQLIRDNLADERQHHQQRWQEPEQER